MAGPLQPVQVSSPRASHTLDKSKAAAAAKPHVHRRRIHGHSPAKSIDSAVFHKPILPPNARSRSPRTVSSSAAMPSKGKNATGLTSSCGPSPLPPRRSAQQIATQKIQLPKQLPMPTMPLIDPTAIEVVEPSLAGVPVQYVTDQLQELKESYLKGMNAVVTDASCIPTTGLPTEIELVVRDISGTLPTHVLAVIDSKSGKGLLFPFHALILASHCANLPNLPPSFPEPMYHPNNSITITVPVVPFSLPHSASFGLLHDYLYTKRYDRLISALLPLRYEALPPIDQCKEKTKENISEALRREYDVKELIELARKMHGLWSNTCKLGIADEGLWSLMHTAWDLLIQAIAMAPPA